MQVYHAHIYYAPESTKPVAARLREEIARQFPVRLGRWHDLPVGPHPQAMYQVLFTHDVFADFLRFLMLNRDGLSILVHPETGDDFTDHTEHCLWLGTPLPLKLEVLRK